MELFRTRSPRCAAGAGLLGNGQSEVGVGCLDWGNAVWENPKLGDADGIHPSPRGSEELAKLMRQALRDDCRR